jgi:carboxyl-terminal processing protease
MNRLATVLARHRRITFFGAAATAVLTAGLVARQGVAELKPQREDGRIAKAVTWFLRDEHLSKQPLNEEMSRRAFTTFMKTLDPMKVYFVQADVDEFSAQQNDIANNLSKKGDVTLAYTIFDRFLKRVDERVALIDDILGKDIDLTVDENIQTDPKTTTYATNDAEIRDKWTKRLKYDLLGKKAELADKDKEKADKAAKGDSTTQAESTAPKSDVTPQQRISKRYHSFAKRMHQTNSDELLERYLTALTSAFDPHTSYMSPSTVKNFDINMKLSLEGIGAALEYELEEGTTKISRLIPGGPAEKDGRLKPEDRVVGVAQDLKGEFVDVADMSLNDVVDLIRGKAGTVVRLKVLPAVGGEPKTIDITRASIELKDQEARSEIFEDGRKANGQPFKIGVIDLPSFYMDMNGARLGKEDYRSTTRDVQRLLEDFNRKGVDAVILDLRRNGGGSLTEAISLTGLFIDEGPIVQVKDSAGRVQHYDDNDKGVAWAGPLVVLQSKFSASASEIFAGAIQDYGRGLIVGDKTSHGKGTVQSLLDVSKPFFGGIANAPSYGALKITIQQFYRPNGDSTQNRGVVSDVELPSLTTHLDVGEADLDFALKFDQVPAANYTKANMVDKAVVAQLVQLSASRVHDSADFQKAEKRIARYMEQKDRKTVPLMESKYLAERAELNTEREEEDEFKKLDDPNRPVVNRDYYFNEAMAVTEDYLKLSKKLAATNGVAGNRNLAVPANN